MYSQNDEDTRGDVDFDFFDAEETDAGLTRAFKFGENDRQRQQHGSPHSSERDGTSSQHDQQSERSQVRIPSAMAYDSDHENDDNISDIEESHQNKKREKINGEKDRSASPSPTTSSKPPKPSNRAKGGKPSSSMNNESEKQKRSSERRQVWGDDSKSDDSYDRRNRRYSHSESDNSDNEDGRISKDRKKQNKKSSTTKQRSNSHSDSDDSYSSNSDYTSDFTDTDSDITDVSPLQSPRKIKTPKTTTTKNEDQHILHSSSAVSDDIREHLVQAKNKGMDLRMLMEAVMELEKEEQDQYARYGHPKSTKKITFDGTANGIPKSHDRKNYSFKDNRVRDIDRENTRLMQEIVQRSTRKQHVPLHTSPLKRVTHSSVNRMKEQRRIELENMRLLKRLETAKPTRTLKRDSLIQDFENKSIAGVKVYSYKKPSSSTRYAHTDRTFSDTTSIHSDVTLTSNPGRRSRPTSASTTQSTSRSQVKLMHAKPEWSDRW